jgi:hypothetical protein
VTPRAIRLAAAGLAALALFAILFSVGHALGAWPGPRAGGFQGVDLAAGLLFGAIVLVLLVRKRI